MARVRGALVLCLVSLAAGACRPEPTAIVLEVVPGAVDPAALDEVFIEVSGPGIDGGTRQARAALRGPEARSFPLTLALVRALEGVGPFTVRVRAYAAGVLAASAGGEDPVAFMTDKVVTLQLVLRAIGEQPAERPDGGPSPSRGPDASLPKADAKTLPPPPPPDVHTTADADSSPAPGDASSTADGGSPGVLLGCDVCDQGCVTQAGPLVCLAAPEGTLCGNDKKESCTRCRCLKNAGK
jgi:hypothetical protein